MVALINKGKDLLSTDGTVLEEYGKISVVNATDTTGDSLASTLPEVCFESVYLMWHSLQLFFL